MGTVTRKKIVRDAKTYRAGGKTYKEIAKLFKRSGYKNAAGNYFTDGGIYFLVNGVKRTFPKKAKTTTTRGVPIEVGADQGFVAFFNGVAALNVDDATKWNIVSLGVNA